MYAVLKSGGKQYKVEEGQVLRLEKLAGDVGSSVKFDQVLLIADGEDIKIGQPILDDVSVDAHIVEQGKAPKILVFKYKRRKRYRRKHGHRQQFTAVQIDSINAKPAQARKKTEPEAESKKVAAKKSATEKPETQKAEAKEIKAKKSAPAKVATRKAEAKKTAPKKAPATKAEPKAKETKKAAPKKSAPKKTTAKKSTTKKEDKA
jgi:large subunit ribosomal protein L21